MWLARSGLGLASLGWTVCMGRPHCSQQRAPPTSGRLAQGVGGAGEAPSGGAEGQWGWLWPPVVSMFPPPAPRQEIARQLGPETDSEALGSVFCTSGAAFPLWAKAALGGCSCPRPVSTSRAWGTSRVGNVLPGTATRCAWRRDFAQLWVGFGSGLGSSPAPRLPDQTCTVTCMHTVYTHTHKRVQHNRTDPTHTLLGRPRTHKPPQQRPCPCGRGDSSSPTHRTPASSSKLGALLPVGRAACWAAAARPAHPHTLTPPKHFPSMGRPPGRPRKARSCHSAEAGWGRVGRALARARTGGKGRVLRPVSESLASMSGHGCT